jgi:hypothetical protein
MEGLAFESWARAYREEYENLSYKFGIHAKVCEVDKALAAAMAEFNTKWGVPVGETVPYGDTEHWDAWCAVREPFYVQYRVYSKELNERRKEFLYGLVARVPAGWHSIATEIVDMVTHLDGPWHPLECLVVLAALPCDMQMLVSVADERGWCEDWDDLLFEARRSGLAARIDDLYALTFSPTVG